MFDELPEVDRDAEVDKFTIRLPKGVIEEVKAAYFTSTTDNAAIQNAVLDGLMFRKLLIDGDISFNKAESKSRDRDE